MEQRAPGPNPAEELSRARALYANALTPANTVVIREILENIIADPAFPDKQRLAQTHAFLADVLTCDYLNRWHEAGPDNLDRAELHVAKAFDIVPDLAAAHYVTGFVNRARGRHEAALAAFTKTIEIDPDFARAYAQSANELINVGRPNEAPSLVQQAIGRTAPGSLSLGMFYWILGRAYFFMGQPQDSVEWFAKSVEVRPNLWYNRLYSVSSRALSGNSGTAATTLAEFHAVFPNYTMARVIVNEKANPNDHPIVVAGRDRFHQGLRLAGMPE